MQAVAVAVETVLRLLEMDGMVEEGVLELQDIMDTNIIQKK